MSITEFFNGDEYFKLFTNFNYEDGKFNQRYKNHQSYDEIKNEPIGMLMNPKYYENEGDDENKVAEPFVIFLKKLMIHFDKLDGLRKPFVKDVLCIKKNNFLNNFIEIHNKEKKLNDEEIENICKTDDRRLFDQLNVKFLVEKFASTLPLLNMDMKLNIIKNDGTKVKFDIYSKNYLEKWFLNNYKIMNNADSTKIYNNLRKNDTQIEKNYPFKYEKFISDYMDKKPENSTINDEIFEEHEFGNLMKRDVTGLYYLDENSDRIYVDKDTSVIKVEKKDFDKMEKLEKLDILLNLEEDENKKNKISEEIDQITNTLNTTNLTNEGCYGLNDCKYFINALLTDKMDSLDVLSKYNNDWYNEAYENIKNINPNILVRFLNKFEIKKIKLLSGDKYNLEYYVPMKYEDWIKNLLNKGQEKFVFKLQSNKFERVNTFFKAVIF